MKINPLLQIYAVCLLLVAPLWGADCTEDLTKRSRPEAVIGCLKELASEVSRLSVREEAAKKEDGASSGVMDPSTLPVGSIVAFYGAEAPDGFLLCDGSAFTKSSAPRLYEWIRTQFPAQVVANDIAKVPDLRGMFLRGAGRDLGNGQFSEVGSREEQSAGRHTHYYSRVNRIFASHNQGSPPNGWQAVPEAGESPLARSGEGGASSNKFGVRLAVIRAGTSSARDSPEDLRPANVSVNFIIKK